MLSGPSTTPPAGTGALGALAALPAGPLALLIGPEGGFAPHELEGATLCSFGEQVLRVETAAVVAGVLIARA